MFKLLNKKKNNKGFTLVELVIVVAILAILVGILAPQYTKYVEKSRKSADASNLEELVTSVKVAASDNAYDVVQAADATYLLEMTSKGTSLTNKNLGGTVPTGLTDALKEYAGNNWRDTTLKSKGWTDNKISAEILIKSNGSVTVTCTPTDLKNKVKED